MFELFFHDFLTLFKENPLGQSFGFLGMGIILYGFFQTDDKKAKSILAVSTIAWVLHFYFLGLYTAMAAATIAFFRMILSIKFQKNIYVFFGIVFSSLVLGFITYESVFHLIPIITSIMGAFAFIFLEKIPLRVATLCTSVLWLYFNIHSGSIGGMTNDILTMFILTITIIRMSGNQGHIHHYKDMINDLLHRHRHIDMGQMIIVKDTDKIIKREGYLKKLYKKFQNRESFKLEK